MAYIRYVLVVCLACLIGCSRYQVLDPEDASIAYPDLQLGEQVKITTTELQVIEFEITRLSESAIFGKNVSIDREDIKSLQVRIPRKVRDCGEQKVICANLFIFPF